jgi:hypothetical protein
LNSLLLTKDVRLIWNKLGVKSRSENAISVLVCLLVNFARQFRTVFCNLSLKFLVIASGTFSIFLVVFVAAVCNTILARAPVIFVQQAEVRESSNHFNL